VQKEKKGVIGFGRARRGPWYFLAMRAGGGPRIKRTVLDFSEGAGVGGWLPLFDSVSAHGTFLPPGREEPGKPASGKLPTVEVDIKTSSIAKKKRKKKKRSIPCAQTDMTVALSDLESLPSTKGDEVCALFPWTRSPESNRRLSHGAKQCAKQG